MRKHLLIFCLSLAFLPTAFGQRFLTDMMDTTTTMGKGIYPLYDKSDRLRFGGYMQPQFQFAESRGAKSFAGGDFPTNSDNRFTLRRGRIRIDYLHNSPDNKPMAYFAFQFDGTERGVYIRDFWGRFFENKLEMFAITTGMFARPMGFEANYSSSDRESPERGRMSQTLMKTERDLGAMITFETRKPTQPLKWMKLDVGVFNGQGLTGPNDYDSHKDVVGRLSLKKRKFKNGIQLTASVSGFYGGITSQSPWIYRTQKNAAGKYVVTGDSSQSNVGYVSPRQYIGADAQLKIPHGKGFTEFRAEYIQGNQTGTAASSETPGTYPATTTGTLLPMYVRSFNGAYFYFLQGLGSTQHMAVVKFDWYDPNTRVKGNELTAANGYTGADVRYNTLGIGYMGFLNSHVKLTVYYDFVMNEHTALAGFTGDLKDNIFTTRIQFRF